MKTIKPAQNQVFAKPTEATTKTASGFILSTANAQKPQTASVINVGGGVDWLKAKDTIVYKAYTTTDIKLDGQDYILLSAEDILGVIVECRDGATT